MNKDCMRLLLAISLVTYNGAKWLEQCLGAIKNQSYKNWQVFVVDNNSQDGSVSLIERIMPSANLIVNQVNLGFSKGHNQNIRRLPKETKYVLCLNQDAILDVTFLASAIGALEKNPQAGALQGKILKIVKSMPVIPAEAGIYAMPYCMDSRLRGNDKEVSGNDNTSCVGNGLNEFKNSNIIDTTGLVIFKNRQVINRGQGEVDRGQYDQPGQVFGADGAASVYRVAALDNIAIPPPSLPTSVAPERHRSIGRPLSTKRGGSHEYFDEVFFAYKEDIDLSWRLRLAGWQIIYEPKAISWHGRSATGTATSLGAMLKQRQQIPRFCRLHSWQNHHFMLLKNEVPVLFWQHFSYIFWRELRTFFYVLLFEPWMLKSVYRFLKLAPRMWRKRRQIMAKKIIQASDLKKWFR